MKTKQEGQRGYWSKDYLLTCLGAMLFYLGFQMILLAMPIHLTQSGIGNIYVGVITGVITIIAVLIRPFAGYALAVMSRRLIVIFGSALFALAAFGYTVSVNLNWIMLVSVLLGIGWGIMTVTFGTIVADLIPAELQGRGIGTYIVFTLISLSLGPVTGQWLILEYGSYTLFITAMIVVLSSLILTQWITYKRGSRSTGQKTTIGSALFERSSLFPALLMLLFSISYGGILSFISLFGQELNISNIGWFFLLNNIAAILVRPITGKLFDTKGHSSILIPAIVIGIASILVLSFSTGVAGMIIAAVLYGISFGAIQPTVMAWTLQRAAPEKRGAANSMFLMGVDVGITIGAFLLGLVANATGFAVMYRWSAILLVAFLVIYVIGLRKTKSTI
ncbi:MFS transporter [Paenibacillus gansuensis]|uniref:MFS transporter n=1 Tax=Paenibacillus gansuensis TaxID=306542 RepID=A0ABW5PG16_9BACL